MNGRRGFLAITAGAVVATPSAAAPSAPAPHLDALLLRLDQDLTKAWAIENEAWARLEYEDENDDDGPYTVAANACTAATGEIARKIEQAHALTLDGLGVKLRAVMWCRSGEPITAAYFSWGRIPAADARIMAGLIHDLAVMKEDVA